MTYYTGGIYGYFKKEDARNALNVQRLSLAIILISLACANWVMEKMIIPKLSDLIGRHQSILWLSIILLVMGLYLLFGEKNYEKINAKIKNYKSGDMIPARELMDWRYDLVGIGLMFGTIGYWIYTIVLPIYSITSQF